MQKCKIQKQQQPAAAHLAASYCSFSPFPLGRRLSWPEQNLKQEVRAIAHETRDSISAATSQISRRRAMILTRFEGNTQI